MTHSTRSIVLALVATAMVGMPCMAQDVEPPFTWEGKGASFLIREGGITQIDFQFELSIDEQGLFEGKTSNEDGESKIQHFFYTDKKEHDWPGFFTRKIVIVLLFSESGDNPILTVLSGRVLMDKYIFGEVLLTGYEEGSETAKVLGVGNPEATLMKGGELPNNLKSTLNKCLPIGMVKIEGDYKEKKADNAAEPEQAGAIDLFNKKDLKDWYIYVPETGVDPLSVWKVQDGTIWCTGKPTSLLRTRKEYSDYKLAFEWRWPEKPGNSGVLLHAGSEDKIWPRCMEAQVMHQRAGDFVGMGCKFNENKNKNKKEGAFIHYTPRMNESNEKKPGEWNTYEIVCKGDTMEASINGQLQNKATGLSVTRGYIGFQSEGVPIVFRNIALTPLQ